MEFIVLQLLVGMHPPTFVSVPPLLVQDLIVSSKLRDEAGMPDGRAVLGKDGRV